MIEQLMLLLAAASADSLSLGGPAEMWDAIVKDFSDITNPEKLIIFLQVLAIECLPVTLRSSLVHWRRGFRPISDEKSSSSVLWRR